MAALVPGFFVLDLLKAEEEAKKNKGGRRRSGPWAAMITHGPVDRESRRADRGEKPAYYAGVDLGKKEDVDDLGAKIAELRAQGVNFKLKVNDDFGDPAANPLAALRAEHPPTDGETEKDPAYLRRLLAHYVNKTHGSKHEPEHFDPDNKPEGSARGDDEIRQTLMEQATPIPEAQYGGEAAKRAFPALAGEADEAHTARAAKAHQDYVEGLQKLIEGAKSSSSRISPESVKQLATSLGMAAPKTNSPTGEESADKVEAYASPVIHLLESGLWPYKKEGKDGKVYNHLRPTSADHAASSKDPQTGKVTLGPHMQRSKWARDQLMFEMLPTAMSAMADAHRDPRFAEHLKQYLPHPKKFRGRVMSAFGRGPAGSQSSTRGLLAGAREGKQAGELDALLGNLSLGLDHAIDRAEDFGMGTRRGADSHFRAAVRSRLSHLLLDNALDQHTDAINSRDKNFTGSSAEPQGFSNTPDEQVGEDEVEPNEDGKITGKYMRPDEEVATRDGFRHLMTALGVNPREPESMLPYLAHLNKERLLTDVFSSRVPGAPEGAPPFSVTDYLREPETTKTERAADIRGRDVRVSGVAEALRTLSNPEELKKRIMNRYRRMYDVNYDKALGDVDKEQGEHQKAVEGLPELEAEKDRAAASYAKASAEKTLSPESIESMRKQAQAAKEAHESALQRVQSSAFGRPTRMSARPLSPEEIQSMRERHARHGEALQRLIAEQQSGSAKQGGGYFPPLSDPLAAAQRRHAENERTLQLMESGKYFVLPPGGKPSSQTSVGPRVDIVEGSREDMLHNLALERINQAHPPDEKGHRPSLYEAARQAVLDDVKEQTGVTPEAAETYKLKRDYHALKREHAAGEARIAEVDAGDVKYDFEREAQIRRAHTSRAQKIDELYSQLRNRGVDPHDSAFDEPEEMGGATNDPVTSYDRISHVYNNHILPTVAARMYPGNDDHARAKRQDFVRSKRLRSAAEEKDFKAHEAVQRAVREGADPVEAERAARASVDDFGHKSKSVRGWLEAAQHGLKPLMDEAKLATAYERGTRGRLKEMQAAEAKPAPNSTRARSLALARRLDEQKLNDPSTPKEEIARIRQLHAGLASKRNAAAEQAAASYSEENPHAKEAEKWDMIMDAHNTVRRAAGGGSTSFSTPTGLFAPLESADIERPHPADPLAAHFVPSGNLPAPHTVSFDEFHANAPHYERSHKAAFDKADEWLGDKWKHTDGTIDTALRHIEERAKGLGLTVEDLWRHPGQIKEITPSKATLVNAFQQLSGIHHQLKADHNRARSAQAYGVLVRNAAEANSPGLHPDAVHTSFAQMGHTALPLERHTAHANSIISRLDSHNEGFHRRVREEAEKLKQAAEIKAKTQPAFKPSGSSPFRSSGSPFRSSTPGGSTSASKPFRASESAPSTPSSPAPSSPNPSAGGTTPFRFGGRTFQVPASPAPAAPTSPAPEAPKVGSKPFHAFDDTEKSFVIDLDHDLFKAGRGRPKNESIPDFSHAEREPSEAATNMRRQSMREHLEKEPLLHHDGTAVEVAGDDQHEHPRADRVGPFHVLHEPTHASIHYGGHVVDPALYGHGGSRPPTGREIVARVRELYGEMQKQAGSTATGHRFAKVLRDAAGGRGRLTAEELGNLLTSHSREAGDKRTGQETYSARRHVNHYMLDRMIYDDAGLHGLKLNPDASGENYSLQEVPNVEREAYLRQSGGKPASPPTPAPTPPQAPSTPAGPAGPPTPVVPVPQGAPAGEPSAPNAGTGEPKVESSGSGTSADPITRPAPNLPAPVRDPNVTIDLKDFAERNAGLRASGPFKAEDDEDVPGDSEPGEESPASPPAPTPPPAPAPRPPPPDAELPKPPASEGEGEAPAPNGGPDDEDEDEEGDADAGPVEGEVRPRSTPYHSMPFAEFKGLLGHPEHGEVLKHRIQTEFPGMEDDPEVRRHSEEIEKEIKFMKDNGVNFRGHEYLGRSNDPSKEEELQASSERLAGHVRDRHEARLRASHRHFINQAFADYKDDEVPEPVLRDHGIKRPSRVIRGSLASPLDPPAAPPVRAPGRPAPPAASLLHLVRPVSASGTAAPPKGVPMPSTAPAAPPGGKATPAPMTPVEHEIHFDEHGSRLTSGSGAAAAHTFRLHQSGSDGTRALVHHDRTTGKETTVASLGPEASAPHVSALVNTQLQSALAPPTPAPAAPKSAPASAPAPAAPSAPKKGLFSRLFGKSGTMLTLDTAKVQMISNLSKAEGDMPKHSTKTVTRSGYVKHGYAKLSRINAPVRPDAGEADPSHFATHLRTTSGVLSKIAQHAKSDEDFVSTIRKNAPAVVRKHAVTDEYLKSVYRALKARAA